MLNRGPEEGLFEALGEMQIGGIAFCPLAQGLLSDKYLSGIPAGSRATKSHSFLQRDRITDDVLHKVSELNAVAIERGQSLAQMALAWVLRHDVMCTALIGASKVQQVEDCVASLNNLEFNQDSLDRIDRILKE
jgi:L-glyceraldehyde 3-phosphate reductase